MITAYCLTWHLEELTGVLDAQCGNLRFFLSFRFHVKLVLMAFFTILEALTSEYLEKLDLYNFYNYKMTQNDVQSESIWVAVAISIFHTE